MRLPENVSADAVVRRAEQNYQDWCEEKAAREIEHLLRAQEQQSRIVDDQQARLDKALQTLNRTQDRLRKVMNGDFSALSDPFEGGDKNSKDGGDQ